MKKEYLDYVNDTLTRIIFSNPKEKETIGIILSDTKAYKNLRDADNPNTFEYLPVKWVSKSDEDLALFVLHMFTKTNQLNLNQLTLKEFKAIWDEYTKDPWFFIQTVNYIRNSDDYIHGDRYRLIGKERSTQLRESNHGVNMARLFKEFQIDKSAKKIYYSKIIALGESLHRLLVEE